MEEEIKIDDAWHMLMHYPNAVSYTHLQHFPVGLASIKSGIASIHIHFEKKLMCYSSQKESY